VKKEKESWPRWPGWPHWPRGQLGQLKKRGLLRWGGRFKLFFTHFLWTI